MSLNQLEELNKQIEEAREKLKEVGKTAIPGAFTDIFEKYQWIEAFKIHSYTPGFNDGEPCYRSINTDEPSFQIVGDKDDNWYGTYDINDGDDIGVTEKEVNDASDDVAAVFDKIGEEALELIYPDNSEYIFKRDGSMEIEDYDYGY